MSQIYGLTLPVTASFLLLCWVIKTSFYFVLTNPHMIVVRVIPQLLVYMTFELSTYARRDIVVLFLTTQ
jgi:hypothetical protein